MLEPSSARLAITTIVPAPVPIRKTAISLVLDYLKGEGVDAVFGIPGGPITPLFDALYHDRSIAMIATRHEGGAAFMAAGYARVSGRIGVCCLTTGPGTTNAVTGIAAAKSDSLPMLVISAQVATRAFGKGSLQDSTHDRCDTVDMLKPACKSSAMLSSPHNLAMALRQGLRLAMTGRRGPVHLNIPTDFMRQNVQDDFQWPSRYRPATRPFDREAVKEACRLLLAARRPAILAGHGVNMAGAQADLKELAELLSIPVATTPKGKGAIAEDHPLALRVFGLASSPQSEAYLLSGEVDVLLVLGSGMHEMSTQCWEAALQPKTALLQLDIDASVIARNYPVDVALVGDAKTTLREMLFELRRLLAHGEHPLCNEPEVFASWKLKSKAVISREAQVSDALPLKPQRLMHELNGAIPKDALIFIDSGNNTLWALHYLNATGDNVFIHNWGEFGAMGFGMAAAIGGKVAAPTRPVISIVGDGSFGMAGMEISTAVTYGIPVVWIVLNDARYNAVHHGQQLQYGGRTIGTEFHRMDVAKIAEGLGARAWTVTRPEEVGLAMREALACGQPALLDVMIDADEVPPIHSRVKALEKFFASERV